jgi:hypothetical protein
VLYAAPEFEEQGAAPGAAGDIDETADYNFGDCFSPLGSHSLRGPSGECVRPRLRAIRYS